MLVHKSNSAAHMLVYSRQHSVYTVRFAIGCFFVAIVSIGIIYYYIDVQRIKRTLALFHDPVLQSHTQASGEIIVGAIDRYRSVHGRLPDSLAALCPDFLQTVPPPSIPSYRWFFTVGGSAPPGGYMLYVLSHRDAWNYPPQEYLFRSDTRQWAILEW